MQPDDEPLVRARRWIFEHGGPARHPRVHALLDSRCSANGRGHATPNMPPEVIANPRWFPFNIYNFASWARATLLPLAVLSARRVVRPLPPGAAARRAVPRRPRTRWTTACRAAARGSRGGCSSYPTAFLHLYQRSASRRSAKPRSMRAWAGSCGTRMPTARGAAFNRRGSTVSRRSTSRATRSTIPSCRGACALCTRTGRTSAAARCTSKRASRRSGTRCSRYSPCRTATASSRRR